jgi:glutamine amidotransferase
VIVIADYGVGNLGSVLNMLGRLGLPARVSARPDEIMAASKLVLPGVGAFDTAAGRLRESRILEPLQRKVLEEKTPILGICLGMQLMARGSAEGAAPGLGWLAAEVERFHFLPSANLKVPHMGWNYVEPRPGSALFREMPPDPRFYFVHSYHFAARDPDDVAGVARYGGPFVAAVEHGNVLGVQFHPEKSHRFGMQLLRNFAAYY